MNHVEYLVRLADILVTRKSGTSLNYVQKVILNESLQDAKKTYDQIALEAGYSASYIKNGVAPKLWQTLTEVLQEKVSKTNCRFILSQALQNPTQAILPNLLEPIDSVNLEPPEGQVPLASKFYIERSPVEALSYQEITQPRALLRIKAPRKMGKTSLMVRVLEAARQQQFQTVKISLNRAGSSIFNSTERFLRWLCANTARQLGIDAQLDEYWDEEMGSLVSATIYFETYILQQIQTPLVLAIDEVNQLFEYPTLTRDVLALLRSWHEETRDTSVWRKLRFVIVNSTEVYIPINSHQSPFNVGLAIELPPFTSSQVEELALRHELSLFESELSQLMNLVNGLPYLVRLGFYHCIQQNISVSQLLKTATYSDSIYTRHLHIQAEFLQRYPDLAAAFDQILCANQPITIDPIKGFKLKSMGLINLDGEKATVSCGLYQQFFRQYYNLAYA
ncbi:MAG: AAA-like domain-containing protein [Microcoleaceae cyanobacterium]